jgi:hypothetical protein
MIFEYSLRTDHTMMNLFFTGYNCPFKRYRSYFPKTIEFIPDPSPSDPCFTDKQIKINIMTHSVGLVKALIFCSLTGIRPIIILAIDPPDISEQEIQIKLSNGGLGLSPDLCSIYEKFMSISDKEEIFQIPICLYRNQRNQCLDTNIYKSLHFYQTDTHYPYMVRSHRDQILKLYQDVNELSNDSDHQKEMIMK